jgi:hypothetical protein
MATSTDLGHFAAKPRWCCWSVVNENKS